MIHQPVPEPVLAPGAFELSVPRNDKGERIGTGAIVEPLRPGLPGEKVRGTILKAIFRAGSSMQASRGILAEQAEKRTGISYVTEQERALPAARKQETQALAPAQSQPDIETTQLLQADKQQTERALAATRSALNSEAAAQAEPVKPQPQERNEEAKQPAGAKAKETETEPVKFYHAKDGHLLFTLQLPKGGKYTTADVNRAARAAGINYTYSPAWTPGGWRMRGRDIWQAIKKAVLTEAPPSAQSPGQKAA